MKGLEPNIVIGAIGLNVKLELFEIHLALPRLSAWEVGCQKADGNYNSNDNDRIKPAQFNGIIVYHKTWIGSVAEFKEVKLYLK